MTGLMDDYLLEPGLGFLSYRINCSLIGFFWIPSSLANLMKDRDLCLYETFLCTLRQVTALHFEGLLDPPSPTSHAL